MTPYVDLLLTPNRSLDRAHALWLVVAVGLVFLLGGVRLLALGAWPVLPFMAIDVALLGWAFVHSYRSGATFETIRLDRVALTVRQVTYRGAERHVSFDSFWTRADLERVSDIENRLWLVNRGVRVAVGAFLSPGEREQVHRVIADGLARCRTGG